MLCTIVGAGPGLAASLARRFGREGLKIALVSRSPRTDLMRSLQAEGIEAQDFRADASLVDDIARAFREIEDWEGRTDTLIYNAAVMEPDTASTLTAQRALRDMATNLGGAIACVQAVLPAMKASGAGTILLTGGGLALEPYPAWTSLSAGKAALRAYGIALHKEVGRDGIRVCVIAVCGIVETGGAFDPARVADAYWRVRDAPEPIPREMLYLPSDADPFYNDPMGTFRGVSFPIVAPTGAA